MKFHILTKIYCYFRHNTKTGVLQPINLAYILKKRKKGCVQYKDSLFTFGHHLRYVFTRFAIYSGRCVFHKTWQIRFFAKILLITAKRTQS